MDKVKTLIAVLITFTLMGCSALVSCKNNLTYAHQPDAVVSRLDLTDVFDDIAEELCDGGCKRVSGANSLSSSKGTMLVTDMVDIQSYSPGRGGIFMSELMKSSLNNVCCYKIFQTEFGKHFQLSPDGLISLTRNQGEIKNRNYPSNEAIVGTYNYSPGKLFIFVRKINIYTGKISRFITKTVRIGCFKDNFIVLGSS